MTTIESILKKHNVYTPDLELDLLRYFASRRDEFVKEVEKIKEKSRAEAVEFADYCVGNESNKCPDCFKCYDDWKAEQNESEKQEVA